MKIRLSRLAMGAIGCATIAGCGSSNELVLNTPPAFVSGVVQRASFDGVGNDLLTAGPGNRVYKPQLPRPSPMPRIRLPLSCAGLPFTTTTVRCWT